MNDLPRPVTVADKYLARILAQLERLEDRLTAPAAPPPPAPAPAPAGAGQVELREPQALLTPLPEDFPGRAALNEAGTVYLETVPTDGAALTAVPGIGPKTANAILTYLKTQ